MKFRSIRVQNFMRYKGENLITFSQDESKNVTIITGDNTFGKTTIAQAFRWGLYGELETTNYVRKQDIVLLNNEVIAELKPNQAGTVSVEIVVEQDGEVYKFRRSAKFKRKNKNPDDLTIVQDGEPLLVMIRYENGIPGEPINNDGKNQDKGQKEGCVQEKINSMLPPDLAGYFFFDGERWSDSKTQKNKIKESINIILGITGYLEMKKHLRDGRANVFSTLTSKIKGSSDEIVRCQKEIEQANQNISHSRKVIAESEEQAKTLRTDVERLNQELLDNRQTEEDQRNANRLQNDIKQYESQLEKKYGEIVDMFSGSAKYFAASLLPDVQDLLSRINLEGKDIPGVTTDTVDYLLDLGRCLCGEELTPDSRAYKELMELRKVIPPEMIGGAAGKFQDKLEDWQFDTKDLVDNIRKKSQDYQDLQDQLYDKQDELAIIERRLDRTRDVAALRRRYNTLKEDLKAEERKISDAKAKIGFYEESRKNNEERLAKLSERESANRIINRALGITEQLYKLADTYAQVREENVVEELNAIIDANFNIMFNDKEKYAKLATDDYRIHVYYRDINNVGGHEEKNISPGERNAINFVFIVSVLELAKRRAAAEKSSDDELDESTIINLPLVLDAPFSNLSDTNINTIATKLPQFAEQIIILMLDKDLPASGLESFASPEYQYHVAKEPYSNYSTIEKGSAR